MRKAFFIFLSALCLSGCFNIVQPKSIAGKVEEDFKTRWIAKRMGELQASGKASDAREARAIAVEDFKKAYAYTKVANTPDPVTGSQR